ncbi:FimV/HubP family polar landmark protein [Shewanella sp. SNU WT4]|uniref:FimV/HubP family polar landmark protein n=1 Tax=Shewanella sp. SNU WT4 TaxID=2590015 RepID=UPI00143D4781|nr:FimV/HubP family polar landmark protein [Shewanella sp. SNU WT4]
MATWFNAWRPVLLALPLVMTTVQAAEPLRLTGPEGQTRQMVKQYGPTSASDTFWGIAVKMRPDPSLSVYQVMAAIYEANPHAFASNNFNSLEKGMLLTIPSGADMAAIPAERAKSRAEQDDVNWSRLTRKQKQQQFDNLTASNANNAAEAPKPSRAKVSPPPVVVQPVSPPVVPVLVNSQPSQVTSEPAANPAVPASQGGTAVTNSELVKMIASLEENQAKNLALTDELARALDQQLVSDLDNKNLKVRLEELSTTIAALEEQLMASRQQVAVLNAEIEMLKQQQSTVPIKDAEPSLLDNPWLVGGVSAAIIILLLLMIGLLLRRRQAPVSASASVAPLVAATAAVVAAAPTEVAADEPSVHLDDDSLDSLLELDTVDLAPEVSLSTDGLDSNDEFDLASDGGQSLDDLWAEAMGEQSAGLDSSETDLDALLASLEMPEEDDVTHATNDVGDELNLDAVSLDDDAESALLADLEADFISAPPRSPSETISQDDLNDLFSQLDAEDSKDSVTSLDVDADSDILEDLFAQSVAVEEALIEPEFDELDLNSIDEHVASESGLNIDDDADELEMLLAQSVAVEEALIEPDVTELDLNSIDEHVASGSGLNIDDDADELEMLLAQSVAVEEALIEPDVTELDLNSIDEHVVSESGLNIDDDADELEMLLVQSVAVEEALIEPDVTGLDLNSNIELDSLDTEVSLLATDSLDDMNAPELNTLELNVDESGLDSIGDSAIDLNSADLDSTDLNTADEVNDNNASTALNLDNDTDKLEAPHFESQHEPAMASLVGTQDEPLVVNESELLVTDNVDDLAEAELISELELNLATELAPQFVAPEALALEEELAVFEDDLLLPEEEFTYSSIADIQAQPLTTPVEDELNNIDTNTDIDSSHLSDSGIKPELGLPVNTELDAFAALDTDIIAISDDDVSFDFAAYDTEIDFAGDAGHLEPVISDIDVLDSEALNLDTEDLNTLPLKAIEPSISPAMATEVTADLATDDVFDVATEIAAVVAPVAAIAVAKTDGNSHSDAVSHAPLDAKTSAEPDFDLYVSDLDQEALDPLDSLSDDDLLAQFTEHAEPAVFDIGSALDSHIDIDTDFASDLKASVDFDSSADVDLHAITELDSDFDLLALNPGKSKLTVEEALAALDAKESSNQAKYDNDLSNFQRDNGYIDIDRLLNEANEPEDIADRYREPEMVMSEVTQLFNGVDLIDVDDEENAVNAKLDLARAYLEIEDADSAKALLAEVKLDGNEQQQVEAKKLLAKLG